MSDKIIAVEPSGTERASAPDPMQGVLSADLASHRVHAGEALEQRLPIGSRELRRRGRAGKNLAAQSQGLLPVTVGQQAVVADPHETLRQHVQEEAAEKLLARERHLPE